MVFNAKSLTSRLVSGSPNNSAKAPATWDGSFLPNISNALLRIPSFTNGSRDICVKIGTTSSVPRAPNVSVRSFSVRLKLLLLTS